MAKDEKSHISYFIPTWLRSYFYDMVNRLNLKIYNTFYNTEKYLNHNSNIALFSHQT